MNTNKKSRSIIAVFVLTVMLVTSGFVNATDAFAAGVNSASAAISAKSGAVLRTKASAASAQKEILPNSAKISILSEKYTTDKSTKKKNRWYSVCSTSGAKGYVRADLVKSIKYSAVIGKTKAKTTYFNGAGSKMKKKGTIGKGKYVNVVLEAISKKGEKWYKIKLNSKYYFVKASKINITAKTQTSNNSNNTQSAGNTNNGKFELVDIRVPSVIGKGCPFSIMGHVKSEDIIEKMRASVIDSSGKEKIYSEKLFYTFDANIGELDRDIKFGTLKIGTYTYKVIVTVDGKKHTVISTKFEVKDPKRAKAIAKKALELAWGPNTAASVYKYPSGKATDAFNKAIDKVYPVRKWGKPAKVGASCDVFVGTVIRSAKIASDYPRGLDEQFKYLKKSDKFTQINYTGRRDELRTGDVIVYSYGSGSHTCIYIKSGSKEYIAEANYKRTYGRLETTAAGIDYRLRKSGKKWIRIYRAVE